MNFNLKEKKEVNISTCKNCLYYFKNKCIFNFKNVCRIFKEIEKENKKNEY